MEWERKKAIQATRATKEHKWSSHKPLSTSVDFGNFEWIVCFDCVLECCTLLLQWMRNSECLDSFEWGGWGGIYSPQPLPSRCWRWAHRIITVHCPVLATSARPLGFGAVDRWSRLSFCCTGQSGDTPYSPVTSDFCALTSVTALFITIHRGRRPLARRELLLLWLIGQSGGTSDSPVNYSEAFIWIPESGWFCVCTGQGHRTVSGVPNFSTLKFFAPNLIVTLTEFLYWFVLNLMHLR
jgi:hypothetical protein